jgi:hypothetical protein
MSFFFRFQVLTAASMKFRVFWDVELCSQVGVDRRLSGAYCLNHRGTLKRRSTPNLNTRRYIPEDSKTSR